MRSFDAAILAAVLASLSERRPSRWLLLAVPAISTGLSALMGPRLAPLLAAGLVILTTGRSAPAALLLTLPAYSGLADAARSALVWALATVLLDAIGERLDGEELPAHAEGAPIKLVAAGILHFALLPLAYL